MLRHLKSLQGYALRATDGDIGTVKDFYFDDEHWVVRYLVVETGSWLSSRRVLISPFAFGHPNHDDQVLPVSITREQVRNSPDVDTDQPVSRQQERYQLAHYGYPSYWDSVGLWGAGSLPGMMLPEAGIALPLTPALERDVERSDAEARRHDDPHLRSCDHVSGYHIKAQDGEIGHVSGWIAEDASWAIRYLIVDTANWFGGRKVLIAPSWISDVSWAESTVSVKLTRQAVRDAPAWDEALLPDRAAEAQLYEHYDRTGYW